MAYTRSEIAYFRALQKKKRKQKRAQELRDNATPAERKLAEMFRRVKFKTKWVFQQPCLGYILDFYFPVLSLCVEVDGSYHDTQEQHFKDIRRDSHLARAHIRTLRIRNEEIFRDPEAVMIKVFTALTDQKIKMGFRVLDIIEQQTED